MQTNKFNYFYCNKQMYENGIDEHNDYNEYNDNIQTIQRQDIIHKCCLELGIMVL